MLDSLDPTVNLWLTMLASARPTANRRSFFWLGKHPLVDRRNFRLSLSEVDRHQYLDENNVQVDDLDLELDIRIFRTSLIT